MDAARTARRLGADEALIVYRRDRSHMPAHAFEADEAVEEGIKIKWLAAIKGIAGPELTIETTTLDAEGHPQPTGQFETLSADAVVLALGQTTESGFLRKVPGLTFGADGTIVVGFDMMTGLPRVVRRRRRDRRRAVGHNRRRPRQTRGAGISTLGCAARATQASPKAPVVSFEMLRPPVYSDAVRVPADA